MFNTSVFVERSTSVLAKLDVSPIIFRHADFSLILAPQIVVNGIDIRLHLCADTGSALSAFFGDFSNIFGSKAQACAH